MMTSSLWWCHHALLIWQFGPSTKTWRHHYDVSLAIYKLREVSCKLGRTIFSAISFHLHPLRCVLIVLCLALRWDCLGACRAAVCSRLILLWATRISFLDRERGIPTSHSLGSKVSFLGKSIRFLYGGCYEVVSALVFPLAAIAEFGSTVVDSMWRQITCLLIGASCKL